MCCAASSVLACWRLPSSQLPFPLNYSSTERMVTPNQCFSFVLLFSVAPYSHHVSGFAALTSHWRIHTLVFVAPAPPSALANSPLPLEDDSDNGLNDFGAFNPFQPGSKMPMGGGFGILANDDRKRPPPSTPGGLVSPRSMRMKELTTDLLACISDNESVSDLLKANEEFLLEQLNNIDAVLEPDSVFTPSMSRSERFEQYRRVMEERIRTARVPAAKNVLTALKDFVSSKE